MTGRVGGRSRVAVVFSFEPALADARRCPLLGVIPDVVESDHLEGPWLFKIQ
jgi:hypothetical protein